MGRDHFSQCSICRSKDRREIEEIYIRGNSARAISKEFPRFSHHAISNHINALGLKERRDIVLREYFDKIIRATLPQIEAGKLRVADGLKAAELKVKLGVESNIVNRIWKFIDTIRLSKDGEVFKIVIDKY